MINRSDVYTKPILKKGFWFGLLVFLFLFAGCSSNSSPTYSAAIAEGRTAVHDIMIESGVAPVWCRVRPACLRPGKRRHRIFRRRSEIPVNVWHGGNNHNA